MGFRSSLLTRRALTLPAVRLTPEYHSGSDLDICSSCVRALGLCGREDCRRQVLPQLAKPSGLLRLIGEAHVEQKERQDAEVALPISDEQAEWKKRKQQQRSRKLAASRKNARAVARSQRRGAFGLAKKIS